MSPRAAAALQHLLPQRLLCAFIYRVARSRRAWIKRPLIAWFARRFAVDLEEAECPNLDAYASFNDFFTRALKPSARAIDTRPGVFVSPADGLLTQFGTITADRIVQAKGLDYSLTELVGERSEASAALADGQFATIYLAPRNYHRVHAPLAARWLRTRYLPGDRYSVNATTVAGVKDLFCRNERVVCWFEGEGIGLFALVLVGALNVSSMSTATRGEILSGQPRAWDEGAAWYRRGDEIGRFNLGSTVVLALPPGAIDWRADAGMAVQMGMALGTLCGADRVA